MKMAKYGKIQQPRFSQTPHPAVSPVYAAFCDYSINLSCLSAFLPYLAIFVMVSAIVDKNPLSLV